jgi:protein gp37
MNKQGRSGIEWTHVYGPNTGYTWNPVAGCLHECQWEMPDGSIAECYAKTIAEGLASAAYPQGFDYHYWHPERLDEPLKLKTPAGIFCDSMSDLMGSNVPAWQIEQVIDVMRRADWHQFQLLTKNAPRLRRFEWPQNVWLGVSAPPSYMFGTGKRWSDDQQYIWYDKALECLGQTNATVKWTSIEPLSFDVSLLIKQYADLLDWVVIGAASRGRYYYQPEGLHLEKVLNRCQARNIPVFYKGNLRWLVEEIGLPWREEFPVLEAI